MIAVILAEADGQRARLVPAGPFDLAHSVEVVRAVEEAERGLGGCREVEIDLSSLERIDGTGAVQLARLIDRIEARGLSTRLVDDHNPKAARLITLYRERRSDVLPAAGRKVSRLARLGAVGAGLPAVLTDALNFIGHFAAAIPKAIAHPRTVN